jgi:hypothetical protein
MLPQAWELGGFGTYLALLGAGLVLACTALARRENPLWATRLVVAGYLVWIVYHFAAVGR